MKLRIPFGLHQLRKLVPSWPYPPLTPPLENLPRNAQNSDSAKPFCLTLDTTPCLSPHSRRPP